jgi:type IV pilus assembly protein PilN
MIRINLLPHREEKRKQKQAAFLALLGLGGVLGMAVVLMVGGYNARAMSIQDERNGVLTAAIGELDKKIAQIATLKQEIEALKARQQAVEDLQGDRNQPVNGYAQSQERVSELLRNLAGASPWLEKPELIEVKAAPLAQGRAVRKVVEFNLIVNIRRPRDKDVPPATGAPATVPAPVPAPAGGTPA